MTDEQKSTAVADVLAATQRSYERAGFTADKIAKEIAKIAFSDLADYYDVAADGSMQLRPQAQIKKKSHALKKIREKTTITESNDGQKINKISTIEIELWDKLGALNMALDVVGHRRPTKLEHDATGNMADMMRIYLHEQREAKRNAGTE